MIIIIVVGYIISIANYVIGKISIIAVLISAEHRRPERLSINGNGVPSNLAQAMVNNDQAKTVRHSSRIAQSKTQVYPLHAECRKLKEHSGNSEKRSSLNGNVMYSNGSKHLKVANKLLP